MKMQNGYRGHVNALEGALIIGLLAIWSVSSIVVIGLHNGLAA